MKSFNTYIQEKLVIQENLVIGDNLIDGYNYHPKDKDELIECIKDKISKEGLGTKYELLDLNDIDTSKITDMSNLFDTYAGELRNLSLNGYFNISDWDVSNVTNMEYMFYKSSFKFNISNWNVSKVENMNWMFGKSAFNKDISNWNVSSVNNMNNMFFLSPLQNNPPKWYKS